ncbi:MAG TPA: DUF2071 domain-containing protein [Gemmatimonadales bacterium]|nr:DUF2071 domain-containing protein [Gemmatimonadales bacterium]
MRGDAPLLTAAWRHLAFLNYEVDPGVLLPRVPAGTGLDTWHGHALVSLIGLRFLDLRVLGRSVPAHRDFDQINLRFYVHCQAGSGEWRRGVVFVREIVPKRAVTAVARLWYGEPYARLPTRHLLDGHAVAARTPFGVRYEWKQGGRWHGLRATAGAVPANFGHGSLEEFITERGWGFNRRGRTTFEFRVEHPPWQIRPLSDAHLAGDAAPLFGPALAEALARSPHSAFLAEGSAVSVFRPAVLPPDRFPGAAA